MSALRKLKRARAHSEQQPLSLESMLGTATAFGSTGHASCKRCGALCLPGQQHRVHFEPTVRVRGLLNDDLQGVHITFTCKRCHGAKSPN